MYYPMVQEWKWYMECPGPPLRSEACLSSWNRHVTSGAAAAMFDHEKRAEQQDRKCLGARHKGSVRSQPPPALPMRQKQKSYLSKVTVTWRGYKALEGRYFFLEPNKCHPV